ncbi:MAG: DUF1501 domain-containing protein [Planctomycetes bacterium]|jgi:hypothetical protein|nr:DUF1501 domain-containing protein [Planctomycetota bacterium]
MNIKNLIRSADAPTRRTFLTGMAQSLLGASTLASFGPRALAQTLQDPQGPQTGPLVLGRATAKHVIYLFMRGGMSHLDTLDPKPGKVTQGPVEALRTRADGVLLGQYFPKLAEQADKVCIVSSMTSKQGAHPQAQYLMRTSYELRGTIQHPSLGAWCQNLAGRHNPMLPGHVILGGGPDLPGAGFFPPEFQPLPIGSAEDGLQNASLPKGVDEERFQRRLQKLGELDRAFADRHGQRSVQAYSKAYLEAVKLMRSSDLVAFDLDLEPQSMHQAYGQNQFGAGCLLARRLVEHGVRYVEVMADGFDTHADNFDRLGDILPAIDQGLAALLADLDARGLLQSTMVVLASEFGRTPDIDQDQGRNHYPKAFSALLAGGGVRGGQRFGATDAEGREVITEPTTIQDLNATIAHACGIPTDHVITSPSGRPFKVADKGMALTEILG